MTERDLLEGRLSEYGARWREHVPVPPVPALPATPSLPHRRRWLVFASAASVAALVAGTLWLTRDVGDDPKPAPPLPVDTMKVVPWAPLDPTAPVIPPGVYAGVVADGDLTLTAEPGAEVPFTITLTSPVGVSLDPCPDYTISQRFSWDDVVEARFALNCDAVPYKDENGVPYLPADTPVAFAMTTTAGEQVGTTGLDWALEVPDGERAIAGSLTVRRAGAAPGSDEVGPSDRELADTFVEFASAPVSMTIPPLAPTVRIGLGADLQERAASALSDPDAWVIEADHQAFVGSSSALRTIADFGKPDSLRISIGDQPRCAGPASPIAALDGLRKISIEPTAAAIDSCLYWFSVGLYVDGEGRISAVTLDLWEP